MFSKRDPDFIDVEDIRDSIFSKIFKMNVYRHIAQKKEELFEMKGTFPLKELLNNKIKTQNYNEILDSKNL